MFTYYLFYFYLGLHYFTSSSFDSQSIEEKWTFTNPRKSRAFELHTSAGECSVKKSDLQNSLSTSFAHNIHPFEIPSQFSIKSALISYNKNQDDDADFNLETEMPAYSKDISKKCFSHHPSKFDVKQDVKFGKNSTGSLLEHSSSRHLGQNRKESNITLCSVYSSSPNISNEHGNHSLETKDHIQSSKSTPTSDGKQGRRNRIAAQFTAPIDD